MANVVGNILLVAGGARPDPTAVQQFLASLPPVCSVVAVDSGLDHARALGLTIDAAVGDMDSVSNEGLEWARQRVPTIDEYPAEKDETDLELGITRADALLKENLVAPNQAAMMSFLGLSGDRADHVLANLQVVAGPRTQGFAVRALLADSKLLVVGGDRAEKSIEIHGEVGDRVSIHPIGGSASGVTTSGLAYQLHNEVLEFGTARGLSNLLSDNLATVSVRSGTALVLQELDLTRPSANSVVPTGGELDKPG